MKIEDFWNQAYLAALVRLPAEEAKIEADKATEICLAHWKEANRKFVSPKVALWKDQQVSVEVY